MDGDAAQPAADAALARAASASWRGQRRASLAYLAPQQASLDARLLDQVRISSSRKVSTVAQQGVEFPITIRNDLAPQGNGGTGDPAAIRVHLAFESDNTRRLVIAPITAATVGDLAPDQGFTGNAKVTARANGTVPVVAQLYTESGRKVGRPVPIEVRVTQNGTTGWAIAVVAGVVLVVSTTWRIRQVGRERARQEAAPDVDPGRAGLRARLRARSGARRRPGGQLMSSRVPSTAGPQESTTPPETTGPVARTDEAAASRRLLSAGAVMAAGTAFSRVLGFVRLVVLVALFENGTRQADMFAVANTLPNSMYILLAGGVLNTVLVPQLVRAVRRDADGGEAYTNRVMTVGLVGLALVTVLLTLAVPLVVALYSGAGLEGPRAARRSTRR